MIVCENFVDWVSCVGIRVRPAEGKGTGHDVGPAFEAFGKALACADADV